MLLQEVCISTEPSLKNEITESSSKTDELMANSVQKEVGFHGLIKSSFEGKLS